MQTPIRITFRHMNRSQTLERRIRQLAERLERFHDHLIGCDVVVAADATPSAGAKNFTVHIELTFPGGVVNAHGPHRNRGPQHKAFDALGDAFEAAKRQLDKLAEIS